MSDDLITTFATCVIAAATVTGVVIAAFGLKNLAEPTGGLSSFRASTTAALGGLPGAGLC